MDHSQRRILVFGLPGAGKTHLINKIVGSAGKFVRLSGGSLLHDPRNEKDRDELRKISSINVISNQATLCEKYWAACEQYAGKHVIFDGHLVVSNQGNSTEIPVSIVQTLAPHAMVFLDTSADEIVSRRQVDTERPNRDVETIGEIEAMRQLQLSIFQKYVKELGVPQILLRSEPEERFLLFLNRLCSL